MPQEIQPTFPGVLAFGLRDDAGSKGSGRAANGQEPMMVDAAARKRKTPRGEPGGACVGFFFRQLTRRKPGSPNADAD